MTEKDDFPLELTQPEGDVEGHNVSLLYKICGELYAKSELVDCTLSCMDGHLQAHRVVLASASTYLRNLLTSTPLPTPCSHPMLFLRNSTLADVQCAMDYIYTGKAQTSKNKLPAMLEISQELGCISLRKSVENAIQNCGIETFRRLANNQVVLYNSNKTNGYSIENDDEGEDNYESEMDSKLEEQECLQITVKQEIMTGNSEDENSESYNVEVPELLNTQKAPTPNAIKRLAPIRINPSGSKSFKIARVTPPTTYPTGNGTLLDEDSVSPTNLSLSSYSTALNLQFKKGESFVYTNEDFGMKNEVEQDEDDNESGGDDESDTSRQIITSTHIDDLLKAGIKLGEDGRPASCPFCMQLFTSLALLQKHIRTHVSNYRPFTCEYCHNTFGRSAHLKRHLRTHTGEKPYKCTVCERAFARQDKLKGHLERHLHNASKVASNNMSITSYPPMSISQSSGGQVPIKVILPTSRQMNGSANTGNGNMKNVSNYLLTNSSSSNLFNGTSNANGLSISIANSSTSEKPRSISGGLIVTPANIPSSTTITPMLNGGGSASASASVTHKGQRALPVTRNFLVK